MPSPSPATGQASFVRVGFAGAVACGHLMPGALPARAVVPLAGPAILHYGLAPRQATAVKSQLKEAEG